MTKIRVIACVVDTQKFCFYDEAGNTHTIPQGDPRGQKILSDIQPILLAGGVATVDLDVLYEQSSYADFEKKGSGLVRFFRVAKKMVNHIFNGEPEPVSPKVVGTLPSEANTQMTLAVDEIIANAIPTSSAKFNEISADQTVMAVVGEGASAKIVPGVEALDNQIRHATELGSTKGVENLISRLSATIDQRAHSVQDVLRFLEKGDLSVADDGSVIGYKVLSRNPSGEGFVDCHTKLVKQMVGWEVRVDEALVDRNRRNECSNGLHVARRAYLGNFHGDVCTLVKVAPEDIITVPHGDPNKVRVCAYHILGTISERSWGQLRNNQPITDDTNFQILLAKALSCKHAPPTHRVQITEQQGRGLVFHNLETNEKTKIPEVNKEEKSKAIPLDISEKKKSPLVDPKTLSTIVSEQKSSGGRKELAQALTDTISDSTLLVAKRKEAAEGLFALKKRSKVSYGVLGVSSATVSLAQDIIDGRVSDPVVEPVKPAPLGERQKTAISLYKKMLDTKKSKVLRQTAATELKNYKKKAKVSWSALCLPEDTSDQINKLIGTSK